MKKRRMLSCLLAVMMCLSFLTVTALATEGNHEFVWNNRIMEEDAQLTSDPNPVTVTWNNSAEELRVEYVSPSNWFQTNAAGENGTEEEQFSVLMIKDASGAYQELSGVTSKVERFEVEHRLRPDLSLEGEVAWAGCYSYRAAVLKFYEGDTPYEFESGTTYAVKFIIQARGYYHQTAPSGEPFVFTTAHEASDWAKEELAKADELGLIPEILDGADLTADITRAEFAAVAVKVYENLSGTAAIPAVINPFTDTKDVEILKAYNIGAVNGTSATTYSPDDLLNREQAAAMLTRVFKKISIPNWTLSTDSQFALPYEKSALFADDADISDWAKESVYFMVANNIINGVGNNKFAPKNVTTEEQAQGYANATREQALIIAVRMVENLK